MTIKRARLSAVLALLLAVLQAPPLPAADTPSQHDILRDGRRLRIQISPDFQPAMRDNLLQWIDTIAGALRQVYGHWPRRHWAISVSPSAASANDPIPWAEVHRGDIDRVEFFTAATASPRDLVQAWTGYHELAHLLVPYRGWGDAWFSEGLASYYQNVLQARSGVISEQVMWQKLYEGFRRGLEEHRFDGQPLEVVSDNMRDHGGYMRVYWSGAWYFLAADTRLRLESGGQMNLDTALARLNHCCADQRLAVTEIIDRLDELNQVTLFVELYGEVATATTVPPFAGLFAALGIEIVDGNVRLQEQGPAAKLRRGISARRQDAG